MSGLSPAGAAEQYDEGPAPAREALVGVVGLGTALLVGYGFMLGFHLDNLHNGVDVRRVAGGEVVIDPELVTRLVGRRRQRDPLAELTDRERQVLGLMAQGLSNTALADELHLSLKTIEGHVSSIFTKLGLAPAERDHRRVLAVLRFLRQE